MSITVAMLMAIAIVIVMMIMLTTTSTSITILTTTITIVTGGDRVHRHGFGRRALELRLREGRLDSLGSQGWGWG